MAAVQEVFHYARTHDAKAKEAELEFRGLDILVLERLAYVTDIQGRRVLGETQTIDTCFVFA